MLLGHWIEMRSIFQASAALRELARLLPSTAQRVVGERIEEVPISDLREGDLVLVHPGASVPADGLVQSGKSDVNESMITGESIPVEKVEGAKVVAGTVNGSGSLRVQLTRTGEHTARQHHAEPSLGQLQRALTPYVGPRLDYDACGARNRLGSQCCSVISDATSFSTRLASSP